MKKRVIVNGKATQVEYSYYAGITTMLSNRQVRKPWGRVTEHIKVSKWYFIIDGNTYEVTRTFKVAGGPYSETFTIDGHSFNSHKKVIEYLLNNVTK